MDETDILVTEDNGWSNWDIPLIPDIEDEMPLWLAIDRVRSACRALDAEDEY